MTLSRKNSDFLKHVIDYGGYATTAILEPYFGDITYSARYKRLKKLTNEGYLKVRNRFRSNSDKEGDTYQITAKTARYFSDENNYGRFQHREEVAYRRMIRAAFLFEVHNHIGDRIISNPTQKIKMLESVGVKKNSLPFKANGGGRYAHVEEHLIDFTFGTFDEITNGSTTIVDDGKTVIFVQSDKYYFNIHKQVEQIKRNYHQMISNNPNYTFNYIIVFDDSYRYSTFDEAVHSVGFDSVRLTTISDTLVIKYLKYLFLDSLDDRYDLATGFKNKWILSFDNDNIVFSDSFIDQTRSKMLEFTSTESVDLDSDRFKKHVDGIVSYGNSYVDRQIDTLNSNFSSNDAGKKIGDLFREVALVEASGRIFLDSVTQRSASEIVKPYLLKKPVVFDNKCG